MISAKNIYHAFNEDANPVTLGEHVIGDFYYRVYFIKNKYFYKKLIKIKI